MAASNIEIPLSVFSKEYEKLENEQTHLLLWKNGGTLDSSNTFQAAFDEAKRLGEYLDDKYGAISLKAHRHNESIAEMQRKRKILLDIVKINNWNNVLNHKIKILEESCQRGLKRQQELQEKAKNTSDLVLKAQFEREAHNDAAMVSQVERKKKEQIAMLKPEGSNQSVDSCTKESQELLAKITTIKEEEKNQNDILKYIKEERKKITGYLCSLRQLLCPHYLLQLVGGGSGDYAALLAVLLQLQKSSDKGKVDFAKLGDMLNQEVAERKQMEDAMKNLFDRDQLKQLIEAANEKGTMLKTEHLKKYISSNWHLIYKKITSTSEDEAQKANSGLLDLQKSAAGPQLLNLLVQKFDMLMQTNVEQLQAMRLSTSEDQLKAQAELISNLLITQSSLTQSDLLNAVKELLSGQSNTATNQVTPCLNDFKKDYSDVFHALCDKIMKIDGKFVGLYGVVTREK